MLIVYLRAKKKLHVTCSHRNIQQNKAKNHTLNIWIKNISSNLTFSISRMAYAVLIMLTFQLSLSSAHCTHIFCSNCCCRLLYRVRKLSVHGLRQHEQNHRWAYRKSGKYENTVLNQGRQGCQRVANSRNNWTNTEKSVPVVCWKNLDGVDV